MEFMQKVIDKFKKNNDKLFKFYNEILSCFKDLGFNQSAGGCYLEIEEFTINVIFKFGTRNIECPERIMQIDFVIYGLPRYNVSNYSFFIPYTESYTKEELLDKIKLNLITSFLLYVPEI